MPDSPFCLSDSSRNKSCVNRPLSELRFGCAHEKALRRRLHRHGIEPDRVASALLCPFSAEPDQALNQFAGMQVNAVTIVRVVSVW